MTAAEVRAWAKTKVWKVGDIVHYVAWIPGVPLDRHPLVYAECQGAGDPVCGAARFSVHGCAGAPTRAEYLAAMG